jgi:hypothetical protein
LWQVAAGSVTRLAAALLKVAFEFLGIATPNHGVLELG